MSGDEDELEEMVKILTEGVVYRTNERTKQLNGNTIRFSFVQQLRKLMKENSGFKDAFTDQFMSSSVKLSVSLRESTLTDLSKGRDNKRPLMETAREILEKYVSAKKKSKYNDTINLSKFVEVEQEDGIYQAEDFPDVAKRGFGVKNRQHKHNDELHAQAQLNYASCCFSSEKERKTICENW